MFEGGEKGDSDDSGLQIAVPLSLLPVYRKVYRMGKPQVYKILKTQVAIPYRVKTEKCRLLAYPCATGNAVWGSNLCSVGTGGIDYPKMKATSGRNVSLGKSDLS
jgi:hypothetical protein